MSFADIILSELISNGAEFGPELQTVLTKSESGVTQANVGRYDYIGKGQINFGLLQPAEQVALRKFFIQRFGRAQGFRFFAPDDHSVTAESIGPIVSLTNDYSATKTYTDAGMDAPYIRRICKLDWTRAMTVNYGAGEKTITPESPFTLGGATYPHYGTYQDADPDVAVRVDYILGVIRVSNKIYTDHNGGALTYTGYFHTPCRFLTDHANFSHDSTSGSWSSIPIGEILPSELGIT
jgi:hypothetical protein